MWRIRYVTVTLAVAVLPVPPSFEVTVVLLFLVPAVIPVTFTENVQERTPPTWPRQTRGTGPIRGGDGAAAAGTGEAVGCRDHSPAGKCR